MDAFVRLPYLQSQEEVQFSHHTHLEFFAHAIREFFTQCTICRAEYDIVYVYLDKQDIIFFLSCKQGFISSSHFEVVVEQELA